MAPLRALLACLVLATVTLAGCVGEAEPRMDDSPIFAEECAGEGFCGQRAVLDETGRDLRLDMTEADSLDVPEWNVGDVFEQHIFYGDADTSGEHIQTMVVDNGGACNTIATSSTQAARFEAVYDLPLLGCIGKGNLETEAFQTDWSWMYDFPLEHGKSWDGSVDFLFNWNSNTFFSSSFTLTAAFDRLIDTPHGNFPGFWITGVTDDGQEFLRYNYVPAVGWFSHFWMYDLNTDASDDVILHMMSMGTSINYRGEYYIDTAETAIEEFYFVPFALLDDTPPPSLAFTIDEGATYMQGVIVPIACPGRSLVATVSPSNEQTTYEHEYSGDPATCLEEADEGTEGLYAVHFIDEPAEPGDWRFVNAGVGVWGYFIWLEAVTEVAYELTAA